MVCVGYDFGGWYDTKAHADALESEEGKFTFDAGITDQTEIYARWIPKTKANYTIVIWKQSVNGVDENDEKLYDYEKTIPVSDVTVGSSINVVTGTSGNRNANVNGTSYGWDGFHYQATDQAGKTVAADNSTIINVWFDRNVRTPTGCSAARRTGWLPYKVEEALILSGFVPQNRNSTFFSPGFI